MSGEGTAKPPKGPAISGYGGSTGKHANQAAAATGKHIDRTKATDAGNSSGGKRTT